VKAAPRKVGWGAGCGGGGCAQGMTWRLRGASQTRAGAWSNAKRARLHSVGGAGGGGGMQGAWGRGLGAGCTEARAACARMRRPCRGYGPWRGRPPAGRWRDVQCTDGGARNGQPRPRLGLGPGAAPCQAPATGWYERWRQTLRGEDALGRARPQGRRTRTWCARAGRAPPLAGRAPPAAPWVWDAYATGDATGICAGVVWFDLACGGGGHMHMHAAGARSKLVKHRARSGMGVVSCVCSMPARARHARVVTWHAVACGLAGTA
jgi:hypothetical protein